MWRLCCCVGAIVSELSNIYIVMKNVVWFSFLVMVAALWSCGGKATDDVRADRPDTIVMKLGPDSTLAVIGKASTAERLERSAPRCVETEKGCRWRKSRRTAHRGQGGDCKNLA